MLYLTDPQAKYLSGKIYADIELFESYDNTQRAGFIEVKMEEQYEGDWQANSKKLADAFDETDIAELTDKQIEEIIKGVALDPIA